MLYTTFFPGSIKEQFAEVSQTPALHHSYPLDFNHNFPSFLASHLLLVNITLYQTFPVQIIVWFVSELDPYWFNFFKFNFHILTIIITYISIFKKIFSK